MSSVASSGAESRGASDDLLGATLSAARTEPPDPEPPVLAGLRREARAFLETRGLPGPKDEAFRFTPLREVRSVPYQAARGRPGSHTEPNALLMSDGVPGLGPARTEGLELETLSRALAEGTAPVDAWLGRVVPPAHGFVAQNMALFGDGVVVRAAPGCRAGVVHVHYSARASESPTLSLPRLLVLLDAGSEMTLVEHHAPGASGGMRLENSVTEIVLSEGARLEHVRIVDGDRTSSVVSSVGVVQAKASGYSSRVFTFGGPLSRLDLGVRLEGPGAECTLEGLYFAGQGDRVDHHTRVDHAVPRTTSRQEYKGIVGGDGLSVFDGTVVVRRGASGTVAHQENRNLLLSNEAVAHSKPHLEIDTDDVKCSHGATVGRLDPAQLFYLRARGIDADVARALLTFAFGRELIGRVGDVALRDRLDGSFAALLPGGAAAREVA